MKVKLFKILPASIHDLQ